MNASARVDALRAKLVEMNVPAMLVSKTVNIAYLTGFDGVFDEEPAHSAVVTQDAMWLYTDGRYVESLTAAAQGTGWEVVCPSENMYTTICERLAAAGLTSLVIEESVPHGRFRFISRAFEGNIEAVDQLVEELRQVKDAGEISRIERAQQLTDAAFEHILGMLSVGTSESDIALELEMFMRKNGSEGVAFPPIVASGPHSSSPHARVTGRAIERGDFVKLDFGARVDGYCADMTRTVVVGQASDRQREIYSAVLKANLAGIEAAIPGVPGRDIDLAARTVLEECGLADKFTHGLGHGVGLEVHELPVLGMRGNKSVRAGSVVTIEPGVYEPGFGGVRIEDLVVVEAGGARVLARSPKELLEL